MEYKEVCRLASQALDTWWCDNWEHVSKIFKCYCYFCLAAAKYSNLSVSSGLSVHFSFIWPHVLYVLVSSQGKSEGPQASALDWHHPNAPQPWPGFFSDIVQLRWELLWWFDTMKFWGDFTTGKDGFRMALCGGDESAFGISAHHAHYWGLSFMHKLIHWVFTMKNMFSYDDLKTKIFGKKKRFQWK